MPRTHQSQLLLLLGSRASLELRASAIKILDILGSFSPSDGKQAFSEAQMESRIKYALPIPYRLQNNQVVSFGEWVYNSEEFREDYVTLRTQSGKTDLANWPAFSLWGYHSMAAAKFLLEPF